MSANVNINFWYFQRQYKINNRMINENTNWKKLKVFQIIYGNKVIHESSEEFLSGFLW